MPNKIPNSVPLDRFVAPVALTGALAILLITAWLTYQNVRRFANIADWVSNSREVLTTTEGLLLELSKAESAGRGFLVTKDGQYREQFDKAIVRATKRQNELRKLTLDNPVQQKRFADLAELTQPKIELMEQFVSYWESPEPDSAEAEIMLLRDTEQMADIRTLVSEIQLAEDKLLTERTSEYEHRLDETRTTLLMSTLIGAVFVLGTYLLLRSNWHLQRNAKSASQLFEREKGELARYNQRLLESTGEGIYGIDDQGICTFINKSGAIILGGKPEDFLGHEMHSLVHSKKSNGKPFPVEECPIYKASQSGDGCRIDDEVFWRLDDEPVPVEYSSFPIKDERGLNEGAVITFNNIAARLRTQNEMKLAKESAEAANESKSQFLANMSHELRTPLNAVIMYSELLAEEAEDKEVPDFIPDLKRIRGAGNHLLELVNGVLDLSKVEAGKMELFVEKFNIPNLINEVVSTVQPLVEQNKNQIRVQIEPDVTTMNGDVTKLRQVLYNLLSNASKFTKEGEIELGIAKSGDGKAIVFKVADSGIGMSPEQVARLFEPFMQADVSTTRKYGGTGLGLAIIKRFTDLMHGSVEVESIETEGTTFTVTMPDQPMPNRNTDKEQTADEDAAKNSTDPEQAAPTAETRNRRKKGIVLVVDDDPSIRDILTRVLVSEGFQPVTASDGEQGLRLAREVDPDLIILDVLMPKVDGWSVLSTLKADAELCTIPVIVQSVSDDRDLGYMLGATEYLVKPVDRSQLVELLQRHIEPAGATVLIVDDDEATRRAITSSLDQQGWEVVEAVDGRQALERLKQQPVSAILLDLMMPVMDGFEFLEVFHENPEWQSIPVVVLTAKDLTREDQKRLNGGVERVLAKSSLNREGFLEKVRLSLASVALRDVPAKLR